MAGKTEKVIVRRSIPIGVIVLVLLAAALVLNPAATEDRTQQFECCAETELVYSNGDTQLAGVDALRRAEGIRNDQLGFIGLSQGFEEYLDCRDRIGSRFGPMAIASWPQTPDDDYWVFWRSVYDYDPMPYWREIIDVRGLPAFIAYGELDEADNVPVQASMRRLASELDGKTLTARVYPDTGHSLMNEVLRIEGRFMLVQGLHDDLNDWIKSNLAY